MNTFGYNSNFTSFFHNDNDNSNHQSPSKKSKTIPPLPKNLRRSIPMKTVLAQPLPIHSTPHRMKKKSGPKSHHLNDGVALKKSLVNRFPSVLYVQSPQYIHCRGVVIKSHTCLFSGVTPYIHTYNSTDMIPRNLPRRLLFYPPTAPYPLPPHPPGSSRCFISLSLSFSLS